MRAVDKRKNERQPPQHRMQPKRAKKERENQVADDEQQIQAPVDDASREISQLERH